MRWCRHATSS